MNTATKYGTLKFLSSQVNKKAVHRWKLEKLKSENVGTTEIEHRAVGMILGEEEHEIVKVKGRKFKRKRAIAHLIQDLRDPKRVLDLLNHEIWYAKKAEKKSRKQYKAQMRKF